MKTLAILVALLTVPASALAQNAATGDLAAGAEELTYEGQARPACVLASVSPITLTNASLTARDANSATVVITPAAFVDPATGVPNPIVVEVSLPITCNTAHIVDVSSTKGGLANEVAALENRQFRSLLPLDVALVWSGQATRFNTADALMARLTIAGAATGTAIIRISAPGGGLPLTAGRYSDSIVIQVAAAS